MTRYQRETKEARESAEKAVAWLTQPMTAIEVLIEQYRAAVSAQREGR